MEKYVCCATGYVMDVTVTQDTQNSDTCYSETGWTGSREESVFKVHRSRCGPEALTEAQYEAAPSL